MYDLDYIESYGNVKISILNGTLARYEIMKK